MQSENHNDEIIVIISKINSIESDIRALKSEKEFFAPDEYSDLFASCKKNITMFAHKGLELLQHATYSTNDSKYIKFFERSIA